MTWTDLFDPRDLSEVQRSALAALLDSVASDARLTVFGSYLLRSELRMAAQNLSAARYSSDGPVTVSCVVAGLPRTGTTLLHNLLAMHEGLRGLRGYEALSPWDSSAGAVRAKERRRIVERLSPDLMTLHRPAVAEAEESNILTASTLLSWTFASTMNVPGYASWLGQQPMDFVHNWERKALHHLGPKERWVIKSPFFSLDYPSLRAAWPTALIVEVERDAGLRQSSWARTVTAARRVYSNSPTAPGEVPDLRSPRAADGGATLRVCYESLIRDPLEVCRTVLELLDLPVTTQYESIVRRQVEQDFLRNPSGPQSLIGT